MFRFLFALAVAFALAGAVHSSQLPMNPGDTVHTTESWEWMDCGTTHSSLNASNTHLSTGNPSDPVQIRNITVFPDPPKPGQDLTVTVSGTVKKQIEASNQLDQRSVTLNHSAMTQEGAFADVVVKIGVIVLLKKEFDVCDEAYVFSLRGQEHDLTICVPPVATRTLLCNAPSHQTITHFPIQLRSPRRSQEVRVLRRRCLPT
jgi:hypothetical protein